MIAAARSRNVFYGWIVVGVAFVTLLVASGVRSAPAVLMLPLKEEFGWDVATVAVAMSINLLLFGLAGPFAAALMDRWGMRVVVPGAMLVIASAALLSVFMRQPWQLDLLWGVVSGLGVGSLSTVLAATIAARWFVQRRGLVMGICSAASGSGQLLAVPLLAATSATVGWRGLCVGIAIVAAATAPLGAVLLRNRPEDLGLLPYGASAPLPPTVGQRRNPFVAAISTLKSVAGERGFQVLVLSFTLCGATSTGILGAHLIPTGVDHGLTQVQAANLLGIVGVIGLVATFISGWLTDRFDPRMLLAGYYLSRSLALWVLPFSFGVEWKLALAIAIHGFDWVATLPPTAALATSLYGREKGPAVVGWVFVGHQIGAATSAYVVGLSRVALGSYDMAFLIAGIASIAAAALALMVPHVAGTPETPRPLLIDAPLVRPAVVNRR
ncbi:MAG: MFS transporter [Thermomicrobiales bacterium]